MYRIIQSDALQYLYNCEFRYDLIYIDPPFNTGMRQSRGQYWYDDRHEDYEGFIRDVAKAAHNVLNPNGTMIVHVDWHCAIESRMAMNAAFGKASFLNEIIWAYDYGGRSKVRWPCKHDNIYVYVKNPNNYTFNYDEIDRIPYMAPGLAGKEKAERGKTLTDVWWHTIVPTNGKEKTGYPTQKPLGILRRFVKVHSRPGDKCLDFFAGSGSFGIVCEELGRDCDLVDSNEQAIKLMKERFDENCRK